MEQTCETCWLIRRAKEKEGMGLVSIAEILSTKQKLEEAEKQYKKQKPKQQHKDYLGRCEREEIMVLAAIASKLEECIENWYKHQRPRKRITYAKTALTYTYKAMDTYFAGMSEMEKTQEVYRLSKDLRQCNIYLERGGVR